MDKLDPDVELAETFGHWAEANGYDPKTKTYRRIEEPARATPRAQAKAHKQPVRR